MYLETKRLLKLVVICYLSLTALNLNGQTFVSESNTWLVNEGGFDFNQGSWMSTIYKYQFMDIVEIDGTFYHDLYRGEAPDFEMLPSSEWAPEWQKGRYYRQVDQKIYFKDGVNLEEIAYDFGLMVGDSSDVIRFSTDVSERGFTTLADGSERKTMTLQDRISGIEFLLIEGIGAVNWTFTPWTLGVTDSDAFLDCYLSQGELLYSRMENLCDAFNTSSSELEELPDYNLVYSDNSFTVVGAAGNYTLKIYNTIGELLQVGQDNHGRFRLDDNIGAGLVVCQLYEDSELVLVKMNYVD